MEEPLAVRLNHEVWSRWRGQLRADLAAAVAGRELPSNFDVEQALFDIIAAGLGLNAAMQLEGDPAAPGRARRAIERALEQP